MAKYDFAEFAPINARGYRDFMAAHPLMNTVALTTDQVEVICRDLEDYADCDRERREWAEQATTNAAAVAWLRGELAALRSLMREWEHQGSTRDIAYRDDLCARWLAALATHETGETVQQAADARRARIVAQQQEDERFDVWLAAHEGKG